MTGEDVSLQLENDTHTHTHIGRCAVVTAGGAAASFCPFLGFLVCLTCGLVCCLKFAFAPEGSTAAGAQVRQTSVPLPFLASLRAAVRQSFTLLLVSLLKSFLLMFNWYMVKLTLTQTLLTNTMRQIFLKHFIQIPHCLQ